MVFVEAKSWKERGLQLQKLKEKCIDILKTLNKPEDDARAKGIIHVRQMCNTIGAIPIKLQQNAGIAGNVPIILRLLGLSDEKSLERVLTDYNQNSKASFITMVQFALENCVTQVIDSIGEKTTGRFSADAKQILSICKIYQPEKLNQILLPTYIRNTLHSNSVHTKPNIVITVDGEEYIFEEGKKIKCGSWSHIFHAILNSLVVYEEIFQSDKINRIKKIPSR
jgi:hypothetical protein